MIKEELFKQLFDKIPQNAKIAILGACNIGEKIFKDIAQLRKDVEIICFIDNKKQGEFLNLPIYDLKEFIDKNLKIDLVIVASMSAQRICNSILSIYDINYVPVSKFIFEFYNDYHTNFTDEKYNKIMNMFTDEKDKILYENLFKVRLSILPLEKNREYFENTHKEINGNINILKKHYIENLNKEQIKTIFDIGFNQGTNEIAFQKSIPNYTKIYAFEPVYDFCKDEFIEKFIEDDRIEIIQKAVGDKICQTEFYVDVNGMHEGSYADFTGRNFCKDKFKKITVDVITIDSFCKENNVYPDFIKMDIEGAELFALKGGIETIKKSRPQLAISIYHTESDFVNIPIYLYEELENYVFKLGHYGPAYIETVLYAIPKELL